MHKCENNTASVHWVVDPIAGSYTLHDIGWRVSMLCAIISTAISLYLMWRHATNYSRPNEQRHIIRILLMIPVYSLISAAAYAVYWYAMYLVVIRNCYEAFAIASFFNLMCSYISPDLKSLKQFFRQKQPDPWPWPLNWMKVRLPRSGLTWFNIVWIGIFQYCFVLLALTLLSLTTEWLELYCESSMHPQFAHVWVISLQTISVTVAMYLLLAFYWTLGTELKPYNPLLKILSIKLVIFFTFWQNLLITLLISKEVLKPSKKVSFGDLNVGIGTILVNVEMLGFAMMHIWAYPWAEYTREGLYQRSLRLGTEEGPVNYRGFWRAIVDSMNPWDFVKAFARGMRWLVCGRKYRHTESRYTKDEIQMGPTEYINVHSGSGANAGPRSDDEPKRADGFEQQGLLPGAQAPPDSTPPNASPFAQYQSYESLRDQEMGAYRQYQSVDEDLADSNDLTQPPRVGLRPPGATATGAYEPFRHR